MFLISTVRLSYTFIPVSLLNNIVKSLKIPNKSITYYNKFITNQQHIITIYKQLISYISTYSIKIVSTNTEENKPVIRLHN